ncbi:ABC transporter permease [Shewanella maritima]|nr:ABC transporter permease [Shewanella maritima]
MPTNYPTSLLQLTVSAFNRMSVKQFVGLVLLIAMLGLSLLVLCFSGFSIDGQNLQHTLTIPSLEHWLGTDQYGRSMLMRLASAIVLSLMLGVICVLTASIVGVGLGLVSVFSPARLAGFIDGVSNIVLALPALVIVLLLSAMVPGSLLMIYIAIALVQWVEYYRVTRQRAKAILASPRAENSRLLGFDNRYLIKRHIIPDLAPTLSTMMAFGAANAILMMAGLGFVYVGIQPPTAELGLMSVELFPYYQQAPWLVAQPLVAISLLVLSFHLMADSDRTSSKVSPECHLASDNSANGNFANDSSAKESTAENQSPAEVSKL